MTVPVANPAIEPEAVTAPVAIFMGSPIHKLPDDLYIPPDVLEIFLETFEGPLDLLLYLVKRNNMDIADMAVAKITEQYMHYIDMMQQTRFDLAAEYLVMAATLAEIKSRVLLPRTSATEDEEADPRAELIRRLQEYERFKTAAESLDTLPRQARDFYPIQLEAPTIVPKQTPPQVMLDDVLIALKTVLDRVDLSQSHEIVPETLSTRERMTQLLEQLENQQFMDFTDLLMPSEGSLGIVITFISLLELVKESLIELVQTQAFAPLHVRLKTHD